MPQHTERQWEGKFFRCGMRCWYCHKPLALREDRGHEVATKDHLTPLSRGGSDTIDNIVPACIECNQRKGDLTEKEFRTAFSEAFKLITSVPLVELSPSSLELQNEPGLLKKLTRERESGRWWRSA